METFSALLALCEGHSPVTGEFPSQRPVTRNFDVSLIYAHYGVTVMIKMFSWASHYRYQSKMSHKHAHTGLLFSFYSGCVMSAKHCASLLRCLVINNTVIISGLFRNTRTHITTKINTKIPFELEKINIKITREWPHQHFAALDIFDVFAEIWRQYSKWPTKSCLISINIES